MNARWLSARPSKHEREILVVPVQNKYNLHGDPSPDSDNPLKKQTQKFRASVSEKNKMTLQKSMDYMELGESWRPRKKEAGGGGRRRLAENMLRTLREV